MLLLRELLCGLRMTALFVGGSCYLGSGAHGHVFRVSGHDEAPRALKVALPTPTEHYHIEAEYQHLLAAYRRGAPVVSPVVDSLRVSACGGGGYLMEAVGDRFEVTSQTRCAAAFGALAFLHASGVLHGDPRVPNLLLFRGKLLWIDLRGSTVGASSDNFPSVLAARVDAQVLAKSILAIPLSADLPGAVATALDTYEPAVAASVASLAAATWAAFGAAP